MSFIAFMMSAGRIINAVTEFLSGFIIDRTHTKIGKARPWILGTSFFVALPVFMVFNCPLSLGQTGRMVWVFVCYLMHIAVFGAVISIAIATLLIKMTSNTTSRTKITNLSNLLGQISQLVVGAYGVPILMYFGGYETGHRGMSFIFCFLGFLLPFLTGIICKEDPDMFDAAAEMLHESTKRPSTPVKTQINYVFSSKYSFPLFAMFLLFNFAAMIFNSIAVHFIRDVLGNALYGIGLAFYGSLLFASTADVADHINLTTKTDVSGLSTSIAQLGMRVGMLFGSVGVSVILSLGKYDAQAANNGIA